MQEFRDKTHGIMKDTASFSCLAISASESVVFLVVILPFMDRSIVLFLLHVYLQDVVRVMEKCF